jgi:hypothetical protein
MHCIPRNVAEPTPGRAVHGGTKGRGQALIQGSDDFVTGLEMQGREASRRERCPAHARGLMTMS